MQVFPHFNCRIFTAISDFLFLDKWMKNEYQTIMLMNTIYS